MKLEIVKLGLQVVILVVSGIIVPAVQKWMHEKTENEKLARIKQWAETACYAAEQIHNKAKKNDPTGQKRKQYAKEMLTRLCEKYKVDISDNDVEALIEAAVTAINLEREYSGVLETGGDHN